MMRHCFALAAKSADTGRIPLRRRHRARRRNRGRDHQQGRAGPRRHPPCRNWWRFRWRRRRSPAPIFPTARSTPTWSRAPFAVTRSARAGSARWSIAMRSPIMGGASRWNILGDRKLSDAMPEVFAPPPVVVAGFLSEEGDATLRRSSPVVWAYMRARGLLDRRRRRTQAGGDHVRRRLQPRRARHLAAQRMAYARAAQEFFRSFRARRRRAGRRR